MENWTDKEWKVFFSIYEKLPRGGPGDNDSTGKAYGMFRDLPGIPRILDIGCGPGMQTLELAKISGGEVWALDNHQPFLDTLKNDAIEKGLDSNIKTLNGDMCRLDIPDNYFDIIWSEGAIYFYGYENAMKDWKKYFRGKPRFAFTEPNWFKGDIPEDAQRVWKEYPQISGIRETVERIKKLGYEVPGHFKLPEDSWRINYYKPLAEAAEDYEGNNPGSEAMRTVMESIRTEIEDYDKYSDYYGYTFYVCEA